MGGKKREEGKTVKETEEERKGLKENRNEFKDCRVREGEEEKWEESGRRGKKERSANRNKI